MTIVVWLEKSNFKLSYEKLLFLLSPSPIEILILIFIHVLECSILQKYMT